MICLHDIVNVLIQDSQHFTNPTGEIILTVQTGVIV